MPLKEPSATVSTIKYYPDGNTLYENPPRFMFMPEGQGDYRYTIEVSKSEDFSKDTLVYPGIPHHFYTPDKPIAPGAYYWRYKIEHQWDYSKIRTFTLAGDLPPSPLIGRSERFATLDRTHPRLWMNKTQVDSFKAALKADKHYCGFDRFYENSVIPCFEKSFPPEPDFFSCSMNDDYPAWFAQWSFNMRACHDAMVILRNLTVAGILMEDERFIAKAKQSLLAVAGWDPYGSTSRFYHDECAFRLTYALAYGYDWLYHHLTEAERNAVLAVLLIRTRQVAEHELYEMKIHVNPYNSHAVRSLSSVLVPACISMLFDQSEAEEWLHFSIEYLSSVYSPWGGTDGGWSEGTGYWVSATTYVLEAIDYIRSYCGIDLYKRPLFHQTANFPFFCHAHDTYGCGFSDGSSDRKPALKTALNVRHFGAVTGNPNFQWYYERCMERIDEYPQPFQQYYDDLFFSDVLFHYNHKPVPAAAPTNDRIVRWFKDVGWVAIHKNMAEDAEHIQLMVKSSPYGSCSHSHADQNGFTLFAYGQPLLINSGFYTGGFGGAMHRYTRQTQAHNTLLFDGKGQYGELECDEAKFQARGEIVSVTERPRYVAVRADASSAYREYVPYLERFVRDVYFIDDSYVVVSDCVSFSQEAQIHFLLHSDSSFQIDGRRIHIEGDTADLHGEFVLSSAGMESIAETDKYVGVADEATAACKPQFHLTMNTHKALEHRIVMLLCPVHKGGKNTVTYVAQGQDICFYSHNGDFILRNCIHNGNMISS